MMTMLRRKIWLGIGAVAVLLGSVLAFLYARTQDHDASAYFENVALLRQLKQLDARWELEALKSRLGVNSNYDPLVSPLDELRQLQHRLESAGLGGAALDKAIQDKSQLIESFKSHNALLYNSLAFLPTAAEDIGLALDRAGGRGRPAYAAVSAGVGRVLLGSMIYSQAPSGDGAAEINMELKNLLTVSGAELPAEAREALHLFALHVAMVLREQPTVNGLLRDIDSVPTGARIDELDNQLNGEQSVASARARLYRKHLLVFAVALVALLLYSAVSLVRSHAEIRRVNAELLDANATLEQRVQERTRELREAQSALLTAARQAGKAEVANNVLHNVGNVLNSVNVAAGLITNRIRGSKLPGLSKAVGLLHELAADPGGLPARDERGKLLPAYLGRLTTELEAEQRRVVEDLHAMNRSIDHIKDIVAAQQAHAGAASLVEAGSVTEVLEDALRMNATGMERHQVTVVREYADVPLLLLDRSRLLQILVNLVRNARHAMASVADRARRMTLGVDIVAHGEERRLRIRVCDEGEGISAENLTHIFAHGFTTRKNGHGFGLHSAALAAREMGGTLSAHSDGPGLGATFTLELPVCMAEVTR